MSTKDQNQPEPSSDEQRFIQRALAEVEKAETFQKIKQIVTSIFLMAAALWFAFKPSGPELRIEATIIIFVGLVGATCTTKILYRLNKNTKDILQAISNLR